MATARNPLPTDRQPPSAASCADRPQQTSVAPFPTQSNAGFTPGPWKAERREHCSVVLQPAGGRDGYSNRVAECPQWSPASSSQPTPDQAYANARLIAAAPELYELLRESLYHLRLDDGAHGYHKRVCAILAKARGEA